MNKFRVASVAWLVALIVGIGVVVYTQSTGDTSATRVQHSAQHLDWAQAASHSHATNGVITLTAAPNQYIYVTGLDVSNCMGAAIAAAAAPTYVTTSGVTGAPQYQIGSGPVVAGTCSPTSTFAFAMPLRSTTAGTNVVFTLPAFITNQIVSVNVYYYIGL